MGEATPSQFGSGTAFIYLFNLVVGTGVLALPSVLISGGWLLGGVFIMLVSFLSYVSFTFVVEAMAASNAILRLEARQVEKKRPPNSEVHQVKIEDENTQPLLNGSQSVVETDPFDITVRTEFGQMAVKIEDENTQPLLNGSQSVVETDPFDITVRTEFGQMAGMFYPRTGMIAFFSVLIMYIYGDGVIYSTVVVRSLLSFVYGADEPDWSFDLFLCIFFIFILPLCFFDFQKTKVLQFITMVIRNVSLATIIVLTLRVALDKDNKVPKVLPMKIRSLPNLFGGAVYSFMCHHSIPGIITPIKDKKSLMRLSAIVFAIVFCIYITLFVSCLYAFGPGVLDPVTFNFPPETYDLIGSALLLFPVFTLSSNFPMILITLRNNLDTLFELLQKGKSISTNPQKDNLTSQQRRIVLTLLSVGPPILCAFIAEHAGLSVDSLVGTSGAFLGCIIMFIVPATLVAFSRSKVTGWTGTNPYASPFSGDKWVYAILAWAILAMVFNAVEKFALLFY